MSSKKTEFLLKKRPYFKMGNLVVKTRVFALKKAIVSRKGGITLENFKKIACNGKRFNMGILSASSLGYWQAKFGQDLFHVLPDLSAVVV